MLYRNELSYRNGYVVESMSAYRMVLVVLCGWLGLGDETPTKSEKMVEKIRRQLMENNYDYMPGETDEVITMRAQRHDEDQPNDAYDEHAERAERAERAELAEQGGQNTFVARASNDDNNNLNGYISDGGDGQVSKKDLLYYMDESKLGDGNPVSDPGGEAADQPDTVETTPKVKYKVIKMRSEGGRRTGSGRRFLQAEGAGGVAVIRLDDGPFPEFRLPRARTQYMHAEGDASAGQGSHVALP